MFNSYISKISIRAFFPALAGTMAALLVIACVMGYGLFASYGEQTELERQKLQEIQVQMQGGQSAPGDEQSVVAMLAAVEEQYAGRAEHIGRAINIFFAALIVLLVCLIGLAWLVFVFARGRVVVPMGYMLDNVHELRHGTPMARKEFHADEFGMLMRQVYQMQDQMDQKDRNYQDLQEISFTDSLTGLYNRSYFFQAAKQQVQIAARNQQPVCVIICDIDHFKPINDNYGHLTGDEALKHAAAVVRGSVREADIVARFGGEEFVVFLNNSNLDNSAKIGEKIRAALEIAPCKHGDTVINMTISIGVALVSAADEEAVNDAIDRADKALYKAKNQGRNQVCQG